MASIRHLQEHACEANRAMGACAYALRRSSAFTPAGLSRCNRRQLIRLLRISPGGYGATVKCKYHASHPPAWSGLSFDQKRQLLQDAEAQYTAAQVDLWPNPEIAANTRALRYLWRLLA